MEFTGERYVPSLKSAQISYEHWHRYLYASGFVSKKKVLDISCGEGFGANILAEKADYVLGVDISREAIEQATGRYNRKNLEFKEGSAGYIPQEGKEIFDVIISFETIEHITAEEQVKFMAEVKRLLKKDGLFIVSTPNKEVYSEKHNYKNSFHIKEFYIGEFKRFLSGYFKEVAMFGQRVYSSDYIWSLEQYANNSADYAIAFGENGFEKSEKDKEVLYSIAVCSDKGLENINNSLMIDHSGRLVLEVREEMGSVLEAVRNEANIAMEAERTKWVNEQKAIIEQKNQEVNEQKAIIEQKNQEINEQKAIIEQKNQEVNEQKAIIEQKNQKINEQKAIIEQKNSEICEKESLVFKKDDRILLERSKLEDKDKIIYELLNSTSWRVTGSLRFASRALRKIAKILLPQFMKNIIHKRLNRRVVSAAVRLNDQVNGAADGAREEIISIKDHFDLGKKTILVIDHYVPTYDKDAGSRTAYQYLRLFVDMGFNVIFIPDNFFPTQPYTNELESYGIKVLFGVWYFDNWKKWIQDNSDHIDFVYFHRPWITIKYIDFIKKHVGAKLLYNGVDFNYLRLLRQYEVTGDRKYLEESNRSKKEEFYIFDQADVLITISELEKLIVKEVMPDKDIRVMPTFVYDKIPMGSSRDFVERREIMFIGGFVHQPNKDGVMWFVEKIFPLVLAKIPDIVLNIVGANPPEEVEDLASSNIVVRGFVSEEELDELYSNIKVVVAPLRFGAGVKGKIIEAVAYGVPVVTTKIGYEGIPDPEGVVVCADSEAEFASEIVTLYTNRELWDDMRKRQIEYSKDKLSLDAGRRFFEGILVK